MEGLVWSDPSKVSALWERIMELEDQVEYWKMQAQGGGGGGGGKKKKGGSGSGSTTTGATKPSPSPARLGGQTDLQQ